MMNFIKSALENAKTGSQFMLGFQAGFALILLYLTLGAYLPFTSEEKNNKQIMTQQVLAAETQLLTPTLSPTPSPTPVPTILIKHLAVNGKLTPTVPIRPPLTTKKVYIFVSPTPTIPTVTNTPVPSQTSTVAGAIDASGKLLNMINQARTSHGVPPVTLEQSISDCSLSHSKQMASDHTLSHNLLADACDNSYHAKAENVGMSTQSPDDAINTIHQGMMNEGPGGGHYENIINGTYKVVGIGIYFDGTTTWITEDFEG